MYTLVHCRIHEREQSAFCHDGYSMEQHTSIREEGSSNNMMTQLTLVLQGINEEISVTMRKRLEMKAKSYPQEEQHLSQLSLPFDFKIQCNHYHMLLKKSNAGFNEVIIREDRENTHQR